VDIDLDEQGKRFLFRGTRGDLDYDFGAPLMTENEPISAGDDSEEEDIP
jgi:hypothetical protein